MSNGPAPWLVVGLGNPGPGYAKNRHNVGFMIADLLAERIGAKFGRARRAATEVAEGILGPGGPKLVIAKPTTFMNLLGGTDGDAGPVLQDPAGADHRRTRRAGPRLRHGPGEDRRW